MTQLIIAVNTYPMAAVAVMVFMIVMTLVIGLIVSEVFGDIAKAVGIYSVQRWPRGGGNVGPDRSKDGK